MSITRDLDHTSDSDDWDRACFDPHVHVDIPTVVCICGSTRFVDEMNRQAIRFTLEGAIVVRPEIVAYDRGTDPQHVDPATKAALDELHLRKIDLADRVFVVNIGGYIGPSTAREVAYAMETGKPIAFLEPVV